MSYLISVNQLKNRLQNPEYHTVIVDVRFQLDDPEAGRNLYAKDHLPGAVYMDLDKELSGKKEKHGGNHPLPDTKRLAAKLGQIGIDNQTTVIIYDQSNDMFAARMWWLLYYLGHENVYVLDGGYEQWVIDGNKVTDEAPQPETKTYHPAIRTGEKADIDEVKEKLEDQSAHLIDSRSKNRYLGKVEPMYRKAGHIPGAKNYFWKEVLADNGAWKNPEELKSHFGHLKQDEEIIVSCGSGVSACPNILALKLAGFENVKLYPGSFSDWISYDENKVETKEE
ncbi:sulfurtransferase [Gracilibacillus phocaeensis]|uniref:sulfurtransferase n=1 Tax=Gracilibacillus phocaeensis TaxID=2042304 RepID=UPI0010319318|nr:sulfurtransferase [Gracilibacillus phocaeensis]